MHLKHTKNILPHTTPHQQSICPRSTLIQHSGNAHCTCPSSYSLQHATSHAALSNSPHPPCLAIPPTNGNHCSTNLLKQRQPIHWATQRITSTTRHLLIYTFDCTGNCLPLDIFQSVIGDERTRDKQSQEPIIMTKSTWNSCQSLPVLPSTSFGDCTRATYAWGRGWSWVGGRKYHISALCFIYDGF